MQEYLRDLSYSWSYDSTWSLIVTGNAKKISEIPNDIIDVAGRVMKSMEGFFIPTLIEYTIVIYPCDTYPIGVFDHLASRGLMIERIKREITNDEGISIDALKADLRRP